MSVIVENSSAVAIAVAIRGVRNGKGMSQLAWKMFSAVWKAQTPGISIDELEDCAGGAANLHLGWFCNEVAKKLGDDKPGDFALADRSFDKNGRLMLNPKLAVIQAMALLSTPEGRETVRRHLGR